MMSWQASAADEIGRVLALVAAGQVWRDHDARAWTVSAGAVVADVTGTVDELDALGLSTVNIAGPRIGGGPGWGCRLLKPTGNGRRWLAGTSGRHRRNDQDGQEGRL